MRKRHSGLTSAFLAFATNPHMRLAGYSAKCEDILEYVGQHPYSLSLVRYAPWLKRRLARLITRIYIYRSSFHTTA